MVLLPITNNMKFFLYTLFSSVLFELFFLSCTFKQNENGKGVYVICVETRGYGKDGKSFKFPNDSIFVNNEFSVQKVMRLDLYDFNGKTDIIESLDVYYLIDFKKGLYKDLGRTLEKETKDIKWIDLKKKTLGFNFSNKWYDNQTYKIKDTVCEGEKIKKIIYTSKENIKYDILLKQNLSKKQPPVLFTGIEDKFKGDLLKMIITYPDKQGTAVYTKKFVTLKNHKVLNMISKYSSE